MNIADEAAIFAVKAHSGQKRKTGNIPYILHPMEVAAVIGTMTDDENVIAAGFLHDTVEDCSVNIETIRELFGDVVCRLVKSETEDKRSDLPPGETWFIRKKESLEELRYADEKVKILWLADKLSNMRSFSRMYRDEGTDMWRHFNQKDPVKQEWYYRTVGEYLREFEHTPAYREYMMLTDMIFGGNNNE